MVVLLKTTSVRVSFIQIMQVESKTRANVFGKVDSLETYHSAGSTGHLANFYAKELVFPLAGCHEDYGENGAQGGDGSRVSSEFCPASRIV